MIGVSFRAYHADDEVVAQSPANLLVGAYGLHPFEVRHYALEATVRQKLQALAGRREAQARDVFDLSVLVPGSPSESLLDFLAHTVPTGHLEEAHARALTITYDAYRGQVIEFLDESDRAARSTGAAWDDMRLRVAALIEAILGRVGRA